LTKRIVFRGGNAIGIVVRAGEKIGFSVLSPRDHWDQEKGENIAIGRAFTKRRGRPWDWRMGITRMVVRTLAMAALPLTDEVLEKLGNLAAVAYQCKQLEPRMVVRVEAGPIFGESPTIAASKAAEAFADTFAGLDVRTETR